MPRDMMHTKLPPRLNSLAWFSICLVGSVVGCGSEFDLAPVSGIVPLNGTPVVGARVVFEPSRTGEEALLAGPGSYGVTGE